MTPVFPFEVHPASWILSRACMVRVDWCLADSHDGHRLHGAQSRGEEDGTEQVASSRLSAQQREASISLYRVEQILLNNFG